MVQIAFLQIVSPMAIVSYLSPKKDNMFTKWLNIYGSTYIDVFVRVAIINFACLIIVGLHSSGTISQHITQIFKTKLYHFRYVVCFSNAYEV